MAALRAAATVQGSALESTNCENSLQALSTGPVCSILTLRDGLELVGGVFRKEERTGFNLSDYV